MLVVGLNNEYEPIYTPIGNVSDISSSHSMESESFDRPNMESV